MSQRLIVLDEAEEELIEAEKWYEKQRAGLGQEFRTAIAEGMERLLKSPLAASPIVNIPAFEGPGRLHRFRRRTAGGEYTSPHTEGGSRESL